MGGGGCWGGRGGGPSAGASHRSSFPARCFFIPPLCSSAPPRPSHLQLGLRGPQASLCPSRPLPPPSPGDPQSRDCRTSPSSYLGSLQPFAGKTTSREPESQGSLNHSPPPSHFSSSSLADGAGRSVSMTTAELRARKRRPKMTHRIWGLVRR